MPPGKVVGGSSSINAMVYMRGHPLDYDRWDDEPGLEDWRYSSCLPYFKAGETSDRGPDDWRGGDGPLGVTRGSSDNPLYDAFLEAGAQAGQGTTDDPNGYDPEGVSRLDATRSNGRRCSAARAYLHPSLSRANLTLKTRAMVTRLVISGNRASGVVYTHGGESHTVEAEKEVILSGGAINSPQTLMLSGIGPADHLREHGIEVRCDLPGVGRNLQDHATVAMMWSCTRSFPVHRVNRPLNKLLAGTEWFLTRGRPGLVEPLRGRWSHPRQSGRCLPQPAVPLRTNGLRVRRDKAQADAGVHAPGGPAQAGEPRPHCTEVRRSRRKARDVLPLSE